MQLLHIFEDYRLIDALRTGFDSSKPADLNPGSILGLEHEPFDRLIREGCLVGGIKELGWLDFDLRDGLCLVYPDNAGFEPILSGWF